MGLISAPFTVSITPRRSTVDFGEERFTDLPTINAVVQAAGTKTGKVFVPRGSDLAQSDVFDWQGREWRIVSWPVGNVDQAFTGDNLGWVRFDIGAAT